MSTKPRYSQNISMLYRFDKSFLTDSENAFYQTVDHFSVIHGFSIFTDKFESQTEIYDYLVDNKLVKFFTIDEDNCIDLNY